MTRGKRSAAVSANLREQLRDARDARTNLEHRLHDAEKDRDAALAKLAHWEAEGNPAVIAERSRADAAVAAASAAKMDERERWQERCAAVAPTWQLLLSAVEGKRVIEPDAIEALADLFGPDALPKHLVKRNQRRNLRSAASVRAVMTARNEAERRGVVL